MAGRTARLWGPRVRTYDQAVAVAGAVRVVLGLHRPPKGSTTIDRLQPSEVDRLLRAAYARRGRDGLICKALFLTGARVSELVALEVGDLRLELCEIVIREGKGGKTRVVPILQQLAHELAVYLGHRRAGPVFESRPGRRFSERRIQQIVQETAAAAGISKRVYPHLLRHTVATHLLDNGMELHQVQRFLGHASIETTRIYAETSAGGIRREYRRALEGPPRTDDGGGR